MSLKQQIPLLKLSIFSSIISTYSFTVYQIHINYKQLIHLLLLLVFVYVDISSLQVKCFVAFLKSFTMKVNSSTMILCVLKHWTLQTFRFRLKKVSLLIYTFNVVITLEEKMHSTCSIQHFSHYKCTVSTKYLTTHWTIATLLRVVIENNLTKKLQSLY